MLPSLPEDLEAELATFEHLSDDDLWLLANTTLTVPQQEELAGLNEASQQRDLTLSERESQQALLDAYNRVIVRRAEAALLLKKRGHKLDLVSITRSLNQFMTGLGDYTKERSENMGDETVEELAEAIKKLELQSGIVNEPSYDQSN